MAKIKYTDTAQRASALTGMAVALYMMERDEYLDSLSLDAPVGEGFILSNDIGHTVNQNLSAKSIWRKDFEDFRLLTGLAVANLMSRSLRQENNPVVGVDQNAAVLKFILNEGEQSVNLDTDESRKIYNDTFEYFHSVFSNSQVHRLMLPLIDALIEQRTLTAEQVARQLYPLRRGYSPW